MIQKAKGTSSKKLNGQAKGTRSKKDKGTRFKKLKGQAKGKDEKKLKEQDKKS